MASSKRRTVSDLVKACEEKNVGAIIVSLLAGLNLPEGHPFHSYFKYISPIQDNNTKRELITTLLETPLGEHVEEAFVCVSMLEIIAKQLAEDQTELKRAIFLVDRIIKLEMLDIVRLALLRQPNRALTFYIYLIEILIANERYREAMNELKRIVIVDDPNRDNKRPNDFCIAEWNIEKTVQLITVASFPDPERLQMCDATTKVIHSLRQKNCSRELKNKLDEKLIQVTILRKLIEIKKLRIQAEEAGQFKDTAKQKQFLSVLLTELNSIIALMPNDNHPFYPEAHYQLGVYRLELVLVNVAETRGQVGIEVFELLTSAEKALTVAKNKANPKAAYDLARAYRLHEDLFAKYYVEHNAGYYKVRISFLLKAQENLTAVIDSPEISMTAIALETYKSMLKCYVELIQLDTDPYHKVGLQNCREAIQGLVILNRMQSEARNPVEAPASHLKVKKEERVLPTPAPAHPADDQPKVKVEQLSIPQKLAVAFADIADVENISLINDCYVVPLLDRDDIIANIQTITKSDLVLFDINQALDLLRKNKFLKVTYDAQSNTLTLNIKNDPAKKTYENIQSELRSQSCNNGTNLLLDVKKTHQQISVLKERIAVAKTGINDHACYKKELDLTLLIPNGDRERHRKLFLETYHNYQEQLAELDAAFLSLECTDLSAEIDYITQLPTPANILRLVNIHSKANERYQETQSLLKIFEEINKHLLERRNKYEKCNEAIPELSIKDCLLNILNSIKTICELRAVDPEFKLTLAREITKISRNCKTLPAYIKQRLSNRLPHPTLFKLCDHLDEQGLDWDSLCKKDELLAVYLNTNEDLYNNVLAMLMKSPLDDILYSQHLNLFAPNQVNDGTPDSDSKLIKLFRGKNE